MRIISQDGRINLPYEMTALFAYDNRVEAVFAGSIQKSPYVIAMYSTQDKLLSVLDALDKKFIVSRGDGIFRFSDDDE